MRALMAIVVGALILCSAPGCLGEPADPLPVQMSTRDGLITNGKVLRLANQSSSTLRLEILVDRTDGKRYRYEVMLSGNQIMELGQLEDVDLASGDVVIVRSGGYADLRGKIR